MEQERKGMFSGEIDFNSRLDCLFHNANNCSIKQEYENWFRILMVIKRELVEEVKAEDKDKINKLMKTAKESLMKHKMFCRVINNRSFDSAKFLMPDVDGALSTFDEALHELAAKVGLKRTKIINRHYD